MPELPEVEVTKKALMPVFANSTIQKVTVHNGSLRQPLPENFGRRMAGRWVAGIRRRGKYILVDLQQNEVMIMHLGMSGSIRVTNPKMPLDKHDHVVFDLANGYSIRFNDPRRFGLITLCSSFEQDDHPLLCHMGPEPLADDQFDGERLFAKIHTKKIAVKQAIMDNAVVVGVGNIYACEALFRAHILPSRLCSGLQLDACNALSKSIKQVLAEAIEAGGSSLRDFKHGDNTLGYFQHQFNVYDKKGEPCPTAGCSGKIQKQTLAGRGTFFCPVCQK